MRLSVALMAVLAAGCASKPAPPIPAERHAANLAAADKAGYKVINKGDRTLFCPTAPVTGSHMAPVCLTEQEFQSMLGPPRNISPEVHVTTQLPGPGSGH